MQILTFSYFNNAFTHITMKYKMKMQKCFPKLYTLYTNTEKKTKLKSSKIKKQSLIVIQKKVIIKPRKNP